MILRVIFSFLLLIHGLIHLMGVAQDWKLTKIEQLSGKTLIPVTGNMAKIMGGLWLLAFLLFLAAVISFLWKRDWWWLAAGLAVVLSQLLVILYWPDAKVGTIANVLILIPVIVAYAGWNFSQRAEREVQAILSEVSTSEPTIITSTMLADLPTCVGKWMERSQVVGRELLKTVHLKQKGQMQTKPDGSWMSMEAEQYFTIEKPAFVWEADIQAASILHIAGRDKYQDGKGNMLIKLLSLIPIADASGPKVDQGSLMRYLAEMIWFPTAALSDYIQWEEINAHTAQAILSYGDLTVTGLFGFDENGDITSFEGQRYYEQEGNYSLETWFISLSNFRTFEGIRIPVVGEVTWKLEGGDFTWLKLEVTDVDYNLRTTL